MVPHHPVIERFARPVLARGVPEDCHVDFLGVTCRDTFVGRTEGTRAESTAQSPWPPPIDEEYIEWIDTLETVERARRRLCVVELGAGYGRWLVRAACAARHWRPELELHLIGVEAEPTHFEWMELHFRDNGLNPRDHTLYHAAVDSETGQKLFYTGRASEWYGQALVDGDPLPDWETTAVATVTLSTILAPLGLVDLLDIDIQGREAAVLCSAMADLTSKVRRVHIGTHGAGVESALRSCFRSHGWYKRHDYECGETAQTPFGEITFNDGVQTWLNPRLDTVPPTATELADLQFQLAAFERRLEGSRRDAPAS